MPRIEVCGSNVWSCIANGQFRIHVATGGGGKMTVTAIWESEAIPPAGTATLTIDGDPTENGVWDLATERAWVCSGYPAFLDFDVDGFPAGGRMTFYFR